MIANMTLDGLEAAVHASIGKSKLARRTTKLQSQVLPAIRRFMADRGLKLSEEKTRITHITEGFDFLGQNVRKYGNKLLIKPAKKSIKSLLSKVKEIIRSNACAAQEVLIRQLNPVIRGWAMYHRHVVAKEIFSLVDTHIWRLLWNWAKRRHPNKGARWVKARYFPANGRRYWNFATKGWADGTTVGSYLFRASAVAITRHVKIQEHANPFDPAWTEYFDRRRASKHAVRLAGASPWC